MNSASASLKEKHRSFEPRIVVVGLPDTAVQESRERVQSAIKNSGFSLPRHRVTVNLAPAAVRKEGPAYDLPIALGVIILSGHLLLEAVQDTRQTLSRWHRLAHARHPVYGCHCSRQRIPADGGARSGCCQSSPDPRFGNYPHRNTGAALRPSDWQPFHPAMR